MFASTLAVVALDSGLVCIVLWPVVLSGGRGRSVCCVSWLTELLGVQRCVENAVENSGGQFTPPRYPAFGCDSFITHTFHIVLLPCGFCVSLVVCPGVF